MQVKLARERENNLQAGAVATPRKPGLAASDKCWRSAFSSTGTMPA
jgi:hypothetical protein